MFKIICVTDRKSCKEDFLTRIEKIASAKPDRIIYREKDIPEKYYRQTAKKIGTICSKYDVPFSSYLFEDTEYDIHMLWLWLERLGRPDTEKIVGVSVHSIDEAVEYESKGVDYVIAGHIFETSCKPDSAPRGLEFLRKVCESVKIPVYAIGGINSGNINQIVQAGADGACIMSGFMTCDNPAEYIKDLRKGAEINDF